MSKPTPPLPPPGSSEVPPSAERPAVIQDDLQLLVECVSDYAIFLLDPQGRVATWNAGAKAIKGYNANEIIGRYFGTFYPEEDLVAGKPAYELEVATATGRFEDEGWRLRKDGTRFWANVVITAVRDASGALRGFGKVTRDLTERRRAEEIARELIREQTAREAAEAAEVRVRESEERYREAAKRAEDANRIKDDFLAMVSHELRTPLNAIHGWVSLLRQRVTDPTLAKPLEVIHRNCQAQVKIIDDILDVSRIIAGKLMMESRPADLAAVVTDALDVVRPSAAAKGITLTLEVPAEPCRVQGDPERLRQVAWNLLSNAVKFTGPGGTVTVRLARTEIPTGQELVLTVTDTGSGIDPQFLPFAFDRFKQADSSSTRRHGGLGLGLAIVRHIVELHGGRVAASSEGLGRGATFSVALPVRDVPASVASARERSTTMGAMPAEGLRVLVVDDEVDTRDLVAEVLTRAGARVETAGSAADALLALPRFRPHVLVSDVGMPGEDGYMLMAKVRELPPEKGGRVPSVALTAYTRAEDRARALAAGFANHVGKPLDVTELVNVVTALGRTQG